jgi:hypothetical protein
MQAGILWLLCSLGPLSAAPAGPGPRRSVEFVGFADNESATAWRLRYRQHFPDGSTDTYALIRLVGTADQQLLASFVEAPMGHRPAAGHPPLGAAALRRRHPDYAAAASRQAWDKVRRKGRFAFIAHDFKDVVVRIAADVDSQVQVEGDDHKVLHVRAKRPGPLGFTPICRLFEGEMVTLGHFRQEPTPFAGLGQPLQAELRVYYSHTGRLVAGLNTFLGAHGERSSTDGVVLVTPLEDPLGATGVGMLQMVESQSRSIYNTFRRLHPEEQGCYRQYIGKWF